MSPLYSWSARGNYQTLTVFNPLTDTWTVFVERVQLLLGANKVTEGKHVNVLLSALDSKT